MFVNIKRNVGILKKSSFLKRIIIIIISFLIVNLTGFSQTEKDFRHIFQEAEYYFYSESDYENAIILYLILNDYDPGNANIEYKIGVCYLNLPGRKERAIQFLEKAAKSTTDYYSYSYREKNAPKDAVFYLGYAYHVNNQLSRAIETYKKFMKNLVVKEYYEMDFIKQQIKACEIAEKLQKEPRTYLEVKLDEQINAYQINFNPAISGNGSYMVYTAKIGDYYHIFYCQSVDEKWSNPVDITNQLETREEGISCSLSYDGKKLFLFKNDRGLANLYESKMMNGKWTKIKRLNKNINSKYRESSCSISPNGKTLYFSSNRKGGYGGLDIYKSELTPLGDWGPAINLGPDINTPLLEDSPFITVDNKTLYFSSQGHYNMGGFDLFYSAYMSNGKWSVPVNLGYPLNTTDDDRFLAPVGNGDSAYYAHFTTTGLPKQEIYLLTFDTNDSPSEITVKGTISLKYNIPDMDSTFFVHIIDTVNVDTLHIVQPAPDTGEYSVSVPPEDYKMVITGEGYEPMVKQLYISENFYLPDITIDPKLVSKEMSGGEYITIWNILFDFDDYSLNREAKIELERMVSIMKQYPALEFEIVGHTDVIGSTNYNLQLSRKRAQSVLIYLVNSGISKTRLKTKGVGEIVAIALNTLEDDTYNPEGRRLNRRVEFRILRSDPDLVFKEEVYISYHLKGDKKLKYTIIVMKVKEKLPDDFFTGYNMKVLKYIRAEKTEDGYLYTLGIFIQKTEAIRVVGKLYEVGFSEARIVDHHELSDLSVSETVTEKILFGNPEGIESIPFYTIQIYALLKPPNIDAFKDIDNIRVTYGKDKFYRYTVGEYIRYRAAKQTLPEIVKKGYQDAFIRLITDLK